MIDEGQEPDPVLVALTTTIDSLGQSMNSSVSLGITLLVSGQVVTGRLTSAGSWWDTCAGSIRLEGSLQTDEACANLLRSIAEAAVDMPMDTGRPGNDVLAGSAALPVNYLHLAGVATSSGPTELGLLRLRMSDVQGWRLGM